MSYEGSFIGLCNPKSPTNVGSVMRAAGCYGVSGVFYTGVRYDRAAKFQTDTHNISGNIPLVSIESWQDLISHKRSIICVEFAEGAIALPKFIHPVDALYIFGPEDGSIDQATINIADAVVYVPTKGCMNLAATVNVLLYDRMAKGGLSIDDNEAIKANRDGNNRLKVKE